MHTQNPPLGSNIKISCVCIYLAETYTAVYVAYEHYNPTVLLMKDSILIPNFNVLAIAHRPRDPLPSSFVGKEYKLFNIIGSSLNSACTPIHSRHHVLALWH